jgi:plastocyanin
VAPTRTATRIGLLSVVVGAAFALAACSGAAATSAPSLVASPSAQASAAAPAASATAANAVTIVDFGFNPGSITVKAGTTVTWTNTGVTHTVTSNTGLFDSGHLGSGDTFTFTFSKAGTYAYHCAIHSSMKGEVTVSP